jgi:hypothetical protein
LPHECHAHESGGQCYAVAWHLNDQLVGSFASVIRERGALMHFEIISEITDIEPIAVGSSIRDIARLRKQYGPGRWRKLKGIARVRLANGQIRRAELHWYEAHGIDKKEIKRKRYVD